MAWKVERDTRTGFIHSVYSGIVSKDDFMAGMDEALRLAAGKGPQKFLTEWVNATATLSTMEIFVIPSEWKSRDVNKKSYLALVVSKEKRKWEDAVFYENICRNRGWQVRVFSDRNEAIAWLEKKKIVPGANP